MPTGVFVNALAVLAGGILGTAAGDKMSQEMKNHIVTIFGICAMGMGIATVIEMNSIPAVVFSLLIGVAVGTALRLGWWMNRGALAMQKGISHFIKNSRGRLSNAEFEETMLTIIVIFCFSGTGIYGAMLSGMNGDQTMLFTKALMDFFAAFIFACELGPVVSVIAIPQCLFFLFLFAAARAILPLTTSYMIQDFKACGGLLTLASGFRMIKVKMFPTAEMIPAIILVMPASFLWVTCIAPAIL